MIYQEIQEINYYIDQHKHTLVQQQADEEIANHNLNEDDISEMLNSDEWDTPKETKISVLNTVEDKLMDCYLDALRKHKVLQRYGKVLVR